MTFQRARSPAVKRLRLYFRRRPRGPSCRPFLRDGPFGQGAVQQWIVVDDEADVLELVMTADDRLRRVALFDALANADRKGGHLLPTIDGHVYGVDHGICFAGRTQAPHRPVGVARAEAADRRARRGQAGLRRARRRAGPRARHAAFRGRGPGHVDEQRRSSPAARSQPRPRATGTPWPPF